MSRISVFYLRLALQGGVAVKASPLGGWLIVKPMLGVALPTR
ncbi:MAG TPA: hypothetical protein PLN78_01615 [Pseudomonadales bacterium]|nr:hypothetical protein [Pseudomonadales bacterium]